MIEKSRTARIQSLDGLRFLAANIVFFSHAQPLSGLAWMRDLANMDMLNSKSAVAFFFVLSGLVLHFSLSKDTPTPAFTLRFLVRRWFRIYPLYYVSLLISALVALLELTRIPTLMGYDIMEQEVLQPHNDPVQWIHHGLLVTPGLNFDFINPPIWTLAAEMRMAFILPFISFAIVRLSFGLGFVLGIAFVIAAPWLASVTLPTLGLIPLFAAGAWAAQHRRVFGRLGSQTSWLMLLSGIIVYSQSVRLSSFFDNHDLSHMYLAGLSSLLILLSINNITPLRVSLSTMIPLRLAATSYGLYVLHFPILLTMAFVFWKMGFSSPGIVPAAYFFTLVAAYFGYRFIEVPMIQLGQRLTTSASQEAKTR